MFKKFLNPDNALMITMTQITDCIFLSLFWLVGCFPIVTAGASFAALYDATFRAFREGEKNSWQRFWQTYRSNWKSGFFPAIFFFGGIFLVGKCLIGLWNQAAAGSISWMLFSSGAFIGMLFLGILCILFPMLSRFENSISNLLKNTFLLGLANLPRTLLLGILNALCLFLCLRFIIPVCFLPSLTALLGSLLIEPMFKPYLNNEEENAAA